MGNFIQLGLTHLNLDQVTHVVNTSPTRPGSEPVVCVAEVFLASDPRTSLKFSGDEAWRLLEVTKHVTQR
jgi:hypothetical protein